MQRGQKTWFLTALGYGLTILLALVLLPAPPQSPPTLGGQLAMAAPALASQEANLNRSQSLAADCVQPSVALRRQTVGSGDPAGANCDALSLARQGPTVRIDPTESVVDVSETFTVTVMIDEADDLGGFEFTLLFVSTTVTVDSVTVGDFPGSTGRSVIPIVLIIDNQAGVASFAVATVPPGTPGPSGTGVLATVALTAQGFGESSLDLKDVKVVDTDGKPQTTTVEDGVVRVRFAVYLPLTLKDW